MMVPRLINTFFAFQPNKGKIFFVLVVGGVKESGKESHQMRKRVEKVQAVTSPERLPRYEKGFYGLRFRPAFCLAKRFI